MTFQSNIYYLKPIFPNVFHLVTKNTNTVIDHVIVKKYEIKELMNTEISILNKLSDIKSVPSVIHTNGAYAFLEKCPGKDLVEYTSDEKKDLGETNIKSIIVQLLNILKIVHSRNIIHRDIKPDNIILDDNGRVYLIDFDQKITPKYSPPEVLRRPRFRDTKSDVWGVGIVCYILITGYLPWKDRKDVLIKHYNPIKNCSPEARDFISKMLEFDFSRRLTIDQALEHPWINNFTSR